MTFNTFNAAAGAPANIDATYEFPGLVNGSGVSVQASASVNVMGAWAELIAATAGAYAGFWIIIQAASTSSARFLVEIGIGAAAAETVIIPGIPATPATAGNGEVVLFVPLNVPAGSRLSARCQSATGSATIAVSLIAEIRNANHAPLYDNCERISSVPSGTYASNLDVAFVTATNTGWTTVAASTARAYGAVLVMAGLRASTTAPATAQQFSMRLGLGGSGATDATLFFKAPSSTLAATPVGGRCPGFLARKAIAASSRLAVEFVAATAAAGDVMAPFVLGFY